MNQPTTSTPLDRLSIEDSAREAVWSAFFAGDCAFEDTSSEQPPIADDVRTRMTGADLSVVNLEATIPAGEDPPAKAGPRKQLAREAPELLAHAGVDAVTLANNHTMDYGVRGLTETLHACHDAGLSTCGAGRNEREAMRPLTLTIEGTDITVINCCEQEFGIAGEDETGVAWIGHPDGEDLVANAAAETDIVIVITHGGIEFVPLPPVQRQSRLREFVDAGADLVIGHHPHVPQGWECYRGTPIFYSLGNFLFEHPTRSKTEWGLALECSFHGSTLASVELVVTEQVDGAVEALRGDQRRRRHLEHLHRLADLTADRDALVAHWQELAVRLFHQRYSGWLRDAAGGNIVSLVRHPGRHVTQDALWNPENRQREMLILLNLLRNESHRAVIETALEVRTGMTPDRRTSEVQETVRTLLSRTEDRPVYDRPSSIRRMVRALYDRLTARVRSAVRDRSDTSTRR